MMFLNYDVDDHEIKISYWPEDEPQNLVFRIEATYQPDPKKFITGKAQFDVQTQSFIFQFGKGEINGIGFGGIISSVHYPALDIPLSKILELKNIVEVLHLIKQATRRYIFAKGYKDGSIFE